MTTDKDNQFLLLSLYLDDEASSAERQKVEFWLKHDPQFRACYAQQVALRYKLRELPTPAPQVAPEVFIEQVLHTIDRRFQQQRRRRWGLGALCAGIATLVGVVGSDSWGAIAPVYLRRADRSAPSEPLMVAMERPVVPLPKALTKP